MRNLFLCILTIFAVSAQASTKKVLVVLSSENKISLRERAVHPTGFFLSELTVPLKALKDAGYEPVFANPRGNEPVRAVHGRAAYYGDRSLGVLDGGSVVGALVFQAIADHLA